MDGKHSLFNFFPLLFLNTVFLLESFPGNDSRNTQKMYEGQRDLRFFPGQRQTSESLPNLLFLMCQCCCVFLSLSFFLFGTSSYYSCRVSSEMNARL